MQLLFDKRTSAAGLAIILVFLNTLGFPGNFTSLTGDFAETAFDYFCFLLMILMMFMTSGFPQVKISSFAVPVYLFLAVIFVESMFVTNYMGLEFISCVRFSVTAIFGLWLAKHYDASDILEMFCSAQLLFVVMTVFFVIIWPSKGFQDTSLVTGALRGLYSTKNSCGAELAFGTAAAALYMRMKMIRSESAKAALYMLFFAQIVMLIMTQSVGAWISAAVVCVYIFFFYRRSFHPGIVFMVVSLGFVYVALNFIQYFEVVLSYFGRNATLTGRTDLWTQIINVMRENHTLTGYGYAMFWRDESAYALLHASFSEYSFLGNMTSGAHNLILDWWLNTGLIGIAALFLMLLAVMRKMKDIDVSRRMFVCAFMIVFTMHGLTERGMDPSNYATLLLFAAAGVAITGRERLLCGEYGNEDLCGEYGNEDQSDDE